MRALLLAGVLGLAASLALADELIPFHTPSGNIHCLGGQGPDGVFVDCDIFETDSGQPPLPRPADCDFDWGHRYTVGATGPAGMGCVGDSVRDLSAAVLPYGQSLSFGPITCSSSERGLECVNSEGRGYFLSRAVQRIF